MIDWAALESLLEEPDDQDTGGRNEKPEDNSSGISFYEDDPLPKIPVAGSDRVRQASHAGRPLPFALENSEWDADTLYLKEETDAPDEEDLQCYLLRKKYSNIRQDDELEKMERGRGNPVPEWDGEDVYSMNGDMRYLMLERELSGGQLNEQCEDYLLILKNTQQTACREMGHFYPLFTLLQGNPSRWAIDGELQAIRSIAQDGSLDEAVQALYSAAEGEVRKQDLMKEQQDRKYRKKQSELDEKRNMAQSRYDKAERRTDRWRH